jgi:SAM-dependent methyltransferase
MNDNAFNAESLETIYGNRFASTQVYRNKVWQVLIPCFFQPYIPSKNARVFDLGCGYGEFINNVQADQKMALDLNPATGKRLLPGIQWIQKKSTDDWGVEAGTLDIVFTSNFFEHLPQKQDLVDTMNRIHGALKPGGLLIAMGPNINCVQGAYWDFWDHHLALTEKSLSELLETRSFHILRSEKSFLPYTMVGGIRYPLIFVRIYLMFPLLWKIFGKQFLVIASKK